MNIYQVPEDWHLTMVWAGMTQTLAPAAIHQCFKHRIGAPVAYIMSAV